MEQYLTELNLGIILKNLFKIGKIYKQFMYNYTKIDYCVEINTYHNIFELLPNVILSEPVQLLIEFDGFYHYSKISQCVKDIKNGFGNLRWKQLDSNIYGLRIPYYIQLDSYFSKILFNSDVELNCYPHGFIDKKCVLPDEFCYYGDLRFIRELTDMPYNIGKLVYTSILNKYKFPKKSENSTSNIVSDFLIKYFDPEFYKDYKEGKICDINDSRYRMLYFNDKYKSDISLL